jgi:hypothetical protein
MEWKMLSIEPQLPGSTFRLMVLASTVRGVNQTTQHQNGLKFDGMLLPPLPAPPVPPDCTTGWKFHHGCLLTEGDRSWLCQRAQQIPCSQRVQMGIDNAVR